MNTDTFKNNEPRIFPYFRGTALFVEPMGYANLKSAQKYRLGIPSKYVYEKFGGKEAYIKSHAYLYKLNTKSTMEYWVGPVRHVISDLYRANQEIVYLSDLENFEEIWEDLQKVNNIHKFENIQEAIKFEQKYGLYPEPFDWIGYDKDDYIKEEKRLNKEIEYKKGIVHINIEYVD